MNGIRPGTGITSSDAADDFVRARRRAAFSRLMGWISAGPGRMDGEPLTLEEMLDALGQRGQRRAGVQTIPLDRVRGSVDRGHDFDADFRPSSGRSRARWQRVAAAMRDGVELPPIEVYEVNGGYFVEDGHHRVSVARSHGNTHIDAVVTEVLTFGTGAEVRDRDDLDMRMYERILGDRVPMSVDLMRAMPVARPRSLAVLAETIEAWATRTMLAEERLMRREEVAQRFYDEEFVVAADLIAESGLVGPDEQLGDAYLRISCQRYWLCRCHHWDEEMMRHLLEQEQPAPAPVLPG